MAGTSGLYRGINWRIIRNSFQNRTGRNLKDKKDFDNTGRIFFTKKKGGLVVYTSTLRNTEQPASKELIENIKMLDLQ